MLFVEYYPLLGSYEACCVAPSAGCLAT